MIFICRNTTREIVCAHTHRVVMTSWALRTDVALACSCMLENLCDNIPCKTSPAIQSFMMILQLKVSYKGKIQCFFRRPWTISNQIHIFMYPSIYFLPYTIYSLAFVRSSICVFPQYIYTRFFFMSLLALSLHIY